MSLFGIPIIIFICTAGFGLAAFLFITSAVPQKSEVARRLQQIEELGYEVKGNQRREAFARIFNEKQKSSIASMMQEAGMYTSSMSQLGLRMCAFCLVGLTMGGLFIVEMGGPSAMTVGGLFLLTFGGAYVPYSKVKMAAKKRKVEIQKALPDFLDMLSSTVQAGLGFNQALIVSKEVAKGALKDELEAALSEVRLGRSRSDALRSMMNRVKQEQLSSVVTALIQAERLGANMSVILEELSQEVRSRRMTRAEEVASLMPTKMVIPMALFMLPALFVMIFGGVAAQYMSQNHVGGL